MPRKAKVEPEEIVAESIPQEPAEPEIEPEAVEEPETEPKEAPVPSSFNPDAPVQVRNDGSDFRVDLLSFGYGKVWPTGAVYTIPAGLYMECLKKGMKGSAA